MSSSDSDALPPFAGMARMPCSAWWYTGACASSGTGGGRCCRGSWRSGFGRLELGACGVGHVGDGALHFDVGQIAGAAARRHLANAFQGMLDQLLVALADAR